MGPRRDTRRIIRIFLDIMLFLSVLFAPWWASVLIAVTILSIADAFEVILAGVALDALYSTPLAGFAMIEVLFTILFAGLFISAWYVKRHLLVYEKAAP